MKRNWATILLAGVLTASMLAGCSGTKATTGSAVTSAASSEASSESSDVSSQSSISSAVSGSVSSVASAVSSAVSAAVSQAVSYVIPAAKPGTVATVRSSVPSGGYTAIQTVALSTTTKGAAIYYTTNGSAPSTKSAKYVKPFAVKSNTILMAIAVKAGMITSAIAKYSYQFGMLSGTITADGSTALQPLLQQAASLFKTKYSATYSGAITIQGGGSGQGITDVDSGAVIFGDSDVTVAQSGKSVGDLNDHTVCIVAVAIAVSPDVYQAFGNGSRGISVSDIRKIYSYQITNWKDVAGSGGYNKPILITYRKKGSGTRTLFEHYCTGVKFDESTSPVQNNDAFVFTDSSSQLEDKVNSSEGAIGYETLPYASKMKHLAVDFENGKGAIACTYQNVDKGLYTIWGYEHMFTKGEPNGNTAAKAFLNFVTSTDFQSTILNSNYGLISDLTTNALSNHKALLNP